MLIVLNITAIEHGLETKGNNTRVMAGVSNTIQHSRSLQATD